MAAIDGRLHNVHGLRDVMQGMVAPRSEAIGPGCRSGCRALSDVFIPVLAASDARCVARQHRAVRPPAAIWSFYSFGEKPIMIQSRRIFRVSICFAIVFACG